MIFSQVKSFVYDQDSILYLLYLPLYEILGAARFMSAEVHDILIIYILIKQCHIKHSNISHIHCRVFCCASTEMKLDGVCVRTYAIVSM